MPLYNANKIHESSLFFWKLEANIKCDFLV